MVSEAFLRDALTLLLWLVLLVTAVIAGHAIAVKLGELRRPRLARARAALISALESGAGDGAVEALRRLPARLQVGLLLELAPNLSGERRDSLRELARELGHVEHAERACRSHRWLRRLYGARLLTAFRAGEGIMPRLARDPAPSVRAQAAEWCAERGRPADVATLLDMLTDPSALCRHTAQDGLLRLGEPAIEPLGDFLASRSGPAAAAGLRVGVRLAASRLLSPALRCAHDDWPETRARAAALLGAIGGAAATERLERLLSDRDGAVRAAAAAALGRLGHWPAGPAVASLLRDSSWPVRHAAAHALLRFDATGELLLRRELSGSDRLAADMARHVLSLPDGLSSGGPVS